ncbi:MAG TPA: hypothetical protein VN963_02005 [bacterium]|nr:hypothetical protein [bacterium]
MRIIVFLAVLGCFAPANAQYQINPTNKFPISSNLPPSKKGPPNRATSVQDRQKKGIMLHKADKFYPINQNKPILLTPSNSQVKPVTVWNNAKKMSYPSLYQDPSN